jgi:hypothetical protein
MPSIFTSPTTPTILYSLGLMLKRVGPLEERTRQRLVNDNHSRAIGDITLVELAPPEQRDAHCLELAGRDGSDPGLGSLTQGSFMDPRDLEARFPTALQRRVVPQRCRFYSRVAANP